MEGQSMEKVAGKVAGALDGDKISSLSVLASSEPKFLIEIESFVR